MLAKAVNKRWGLIKQAIYSAYFPLIYYIKTMLMWRNNMFNLFSKSEEEPKAGHDLRGQSNCSGRNKASWRGSARWVFGFRSRSGLLSPGHPHPFTVLQTNTIHVEKKRFQLPQELSFTHFQGQPRQHPRKPDFKLKTHPAATHRAPLRHFAFLFCLWSDATSA